MKILTATARRKLRHITLCRTRRGRSVAIPKENKIRHHDEYYNTSEMKRETSLQYSTTNYASPVKVLMQLYLREQPFHSRQGFYTYLMSLSSVTSVRIVTGYIVQESQTQTLMPLFPPSHVHNHCRVQEK